jgi:hypothetical protein
MKEHGLCNCHVCYCQHCASDYVCGDCMVGKHSGQPKRSKSKFEEWKKNGFFIGTKQIYDHLTGKIRQPFKDDKS